MDLPDLEDAMVEYFTFGQATSENDLSSYARDKKKTNHLEHIFRTEVEQLVNP